MLELLSISGQNLAVHGIKKGVNKQRVCLSDVGPVTFLVYFPYEMLRKNSPNNSTFNLHRSYDAMKNNYNNSFITWPFNMPRNRNNNNTLKEQDDVETDEN